MPIPTDPDDQLTRLRRILAKRQAKHFGDPARGPPSRRERDGVLALKEQIRELQHVVDYGAQPEAKEETQPVEQTAEQRDAAEMYGRRREMMQGRSRGVRVRRLGEGFLRGQLLGPGRRRNRNRKEGRIRVEEKAEAEAREARMGEEMKMETETGGAPWVAGAVEEEEEGITTGMSQITLTLRPKA